MTIIIFFSDYVFIIDDTVECRYNVVQQNIISKHHCIDWGRI